MADYQTSAEHAQYEEEHVHSVYESIANHFSSTRFKLWPVVDEFLRKLQPGAVGLDVGCGNGKYLSVRQDVFIVGSDRSTELIRIASQYQAHAVLVADTLSLPHPARAFDFAISIAVVHHLSTSVRRRQAIKHILDLLRSPSDQKQPGQALFFVWALEQKGSRRGWDAGDEQDILVPWVLKQEAVSQDEPTVYQRYYHLYRKGELEEDIAAAGGKVVRAGYDRDNWWAVAESLY